MGIGRVRGNSKSPDSDGKDRGHVSPGDLAGFMRSLADCRLKGLPIAGIPSLRSVVSEQGAAAEPLDYAVNDLFRVGRDAIRYDPDVRGQRPNLDAFASQRFRDPNDHL